MPPGPGLPARVYVHTLGCPKNEADSRSVERGLLAAGVTLVDDPEESTHILLNTCGFIDDAKEESIGAVLDACARYGDRAVMVMGCLVERYRAELAEGIPEVAAWFGLADAGAQGQLLGFLGREERAQERSVTLGTPTGEAYSYLKISDGCDGPCTFCAIPDIKGPYRSIAAKEILREADACLKEGARELVLVGQDTTRWEEEGLDLMGLVDRLASDERVRRLRLMYLQPERVTDSFLEYMASSPKLCRYLDIPFQHSHPEMLRAMGRHGNGDAYLELIQRARRLMPDVAVRSTFIVGFPGESERHFDHLLAFVEQAAFDYAGGFVYSPEEGTDAAELRPRVSKAKAHVRLNRLTSTLEATAELAHRGLVGSRVDVMVDVGEGDEAEQGFTRVGRTRGQAPEVDGVTYIEGAVPEGTVPGDVVMVKVTSVMGYDLVGTHDGP